jgi:peptidoglycan-N-acetylglucosamine deacetylase
MKLITTSWDDGYILDFRLAELLDKYRLKGTFYIPKTNKENPVMSEKDMADLSRSFEVGGHPINHIRLYKNRAEDYLNEIQGCYHWINNITGITPISFCFPGGVFNDLAIRHAKIAGFKILRTTELLSVGKLSNNGLMPTTLQVFEHTKYTYVKHLVKRGRIGNMIMWLKNNPPSDILKLTDYYLDNVNANNGCFHLWGHSWEIEQENLWDKLEMLLQHLTHRSDFTSVTNGELGNYYG